MSTVTRSEVKEVEVSMVSSDPPLGRILAVAVAGAVISGMSLAARKAFEKLSPALEQPGKTGDALRPVSLLREEFGQIKQEKALHPLKDFHLPVHEALKVQTLLTLRTTPFRIDNPTALEQPLYAFRLADTTMKVHDAQRQLYNSLELSHDKVFKETLTRACMRAATKIGFSTVQSEVGPNGSVRIASTDPAGRALITEITGGVDRPLALATEVVGVTDGSCLGIISTFEKALESEGVRTSTPKRKSTGGVCDLVAARAFVMKKLKPMKSTHEIKNAVTPDQNTRRKQRINLAQRQNLR